MEAATGIEPVVRVLQTRALPLGYAAYMSTNMERKTGFEPATPTLARLYSTTELLPQKYEMRVKGVEPPRPKALDPKSSVSASSTIPA